MKRYGGIIMQAVEFGTFVNNGIIEIPTIYRKDYSNDVRVILIKDNLDKVDNKPSIQERIAAAERLVGIASENTLSLEEIRNERLARQ
jgi:hypothetical protein